MTEPATLSHITLTEAFDVMSDELTEHLDRLLGIPRTIKVDQSAGGWYCATIDNGRILFPPTENLDTVIRFVRAFAKKNAKKGVVLDEDSIEFYRMERARTGFSVAVPDNVIDLPVRDGVGA